MSALARRLGEAFGEVLALLDGPAPALARRPAPEAWSALEVAEHVALANHHLLLLAEKLARRDGRGDAARPAEPVDLERLAARGFRWESPAHMRPRAAATAGEIAATLRLQRRRCLLLLAGTRRARGGHGLSFSVAGPGARLDLAGWLTLVALHLERHARQMRRSLAPGS